MHIWKFLEIFVAICHRHLMNESAWLLWWNTRIWHSAEVTLLSEPPDVCILAVKLSGFQTAVIWPMEPRIISFSHFPEWNVSGAKWKQRIWSKGNMITVFHSQLKGQQALKPRLQSGCRIWIHWHWQLAHISPSSFLPLSTWIYSLLWPRGCSQDIHFFIFIYLFIFYSAACISQKSIKDSGSC